MNVEFFRLEIEDGRTFSISNSLQPIGKAQMTTMFGVIDSSPTLCLMADDKYPVHEFPDGSFSIIIDGVSTPAEKVALLA